MGDGFYRSKDTNNSINLQLTEGKATKENPEKNRLSMVLRLHQHNIGYTADGFYITRQH